MAGLPELFPGGAKKGDPRGDCPLASLGAADQLRCMWLATMRNLPVICGAFRSLGGVTQMMVSMAINPDAATGLPTSLSGSISVAKGNRGRRYTSEPGESFQMDWGFVTVEQASGSSYKAACFTMICHCCGERYVEFFPNAKQENLFIGMLHTFERMGIPQHILTDNMKSVTTGPLCIF